VGCLRLGLTVLGNADLCQGLGVKGSRLGGRQLRLTPGVPVLRLAPSMQKGGGNLNERTSDREDDDKQREMEERGEENAA
jgi:hypothetical protein